MMNIQKNRYTGIPDHIGTMRYLNCKIKLIIKSYIKRKIIIKDNNVSIRGFYYKNAENNFIFIIFITVLVMFL